VRVVPGLPVRPPARVQATPLQGLGRLLAGQARDPGVEVDRADALLSLVAAELAMGI
jgi:hypothetical protein